MHTAHGAVDFAYNPNQLKEKMKQSTNKYITLGD